MFSVSLHKPDWVDRQDNSHSGSCRSWLVERRLEVGSVLTMSQQVKYPESSSKMQSGLVLVVPLAGQLDGGKRFQETWCLAQRISPIEILNVSTKLAVSLLSACALQTL